MAETPGFGHWTVEGIQERFITAGLGVARTVERRCPPAAALRLNPVLK